MTCCMKLNLSPARGLRKLKTTTLEVLAAPSEVRPVSSPLGSIATKDSSEALDSRSMVGMRHRLVLPARVSAMTVEFMSLVE